MSTLSHTSSTRSRSQTRQASMEKTPRPNALFLNKPLANGSSISVNELPTPTTPGLRSHIGHLLPRHTYFRARILIHQVQSVPFMSGEFGVRWKLKSVHTPTTHKQGLFDRVMGGGERRGSTDKGKAREDVGAASWPPTPTEDSGRTSSGWRRKAATAPLPTPLQGTPSVSSRSSLAGHSQHLSADWPSSTNTSGFSSNSTATLGPSTTDSSNTLLTLTPSTTLARGITPFLKLKDHSVTWSYMLDPLLKLDIDRETSQVLPSPVKLVVMQRVIPDDPDGPPQNPRLGAVYLNLAEYIGQGSVERRYLLKESKTNATLRITIEMEYVSGETAYIPPPLAKGEILTGLAGFLDQDVVRKRPRVLDVYGPYNDQEELEIDLLGGGPPPRSPGGTLGVGDGGDIGVAFEVQRLPFAYGTKTTETLIDALFNPTRTTEPRNESPFTYYDPPPEAQGAGFGLGFAGGVPQRAPLGARQGSMSTTGTGGSEYSAFGTTSSSSSASIRTTTSESSKSRPAPHCAPPNGGGAPDGRVVVSGCTNGAAQKSQPDADRPDAPTGVRGWWKRRTTRPDTPSPRKSN